MASFTEKIRLLFEVDDKGSLGRLRADIAAADGVTGKFKAGIKGAGDMLKQNMAAGAMAAGAAVFTYGVKAVAAFQDTALAAGKMADATGLTVEQSSRLMEVAGDLGIEVGTVQGAIQKFNNAVAGGRLDEFADSIVTAKDGSIDAYESFINTATAIGQIQDPTKRAQAAQKAFGKSYGEIAELMKMDADQLRSALDGVSDAKVIDENELRQARQFRDLLDQLKDRLDDVQLTVGERVIPRLLMMGKAVTGIADALDKIPDGGLLFGFDSDSERKALTAIGLYDDAAMAVGEVIDKTTDLAESIPLATEAQSDLNDTVQGGSGTFETSADVFARYEAAAADVTDELGALQDAYRALKGELDQDQAWLNLEDKMRQFRWDMASGKLSIDDKRAALVDIKSELLNYLSSLEGVPAEKQTEVLALIDQGKLDEAEALLENLSRARFVAINPVTGGQMVNVTTGINGRRALGGDVAPGGTYLVGENGPEYLKMGATGGTVIPNHALAGTTNYFITNQIKADPNGFVQSLKQYERINGTRWRR